MRPYIRGNLSEYNPKMHRVKYTQFSLPLLLPTLLPPPFTPYSSPSPFNPYSFLPLDSQKISTYPTFMTTDPSLTRWSDRLAFDVALTLEGSGETLQEIMARHHIGPNEILVFNSDPVFLKKVEQYRTEIRDKGMTFRLKARAQAEELLTTSWLLIHDPLVSPAVKADLIKSTVKWANLEPKGNETTTEGSGVSITINLGNDNKQPRVINVGAETDEQEVQQLSGVQ
jgi:hypothetical protein